MSPAGQRAAQSRKCVEARDAVEATAVFGDVREVEDALHPAAPAPGRRLGQDLLGQVPVQLFGPLV